MKLGGSAGGVSSKLEDVTEALNQLRVSCMQGKSRQEQVIASLKTNIAELTEKQKVITSNVSEQFDKVMGSLPCAVSHCIDIPAACHQLAIDTM